MCALCMATLLLRLEVLIQMSCCTIILQAIERGHETGAKLSQTHLQVFQLLSILVM